MNIRSLFIKLLTAFLLFLVLFLLREPILRGIGNALMHEDTLEKVDAIFVLGGNSYDRGKEAIKLYNQGFAPIIIASGGNTAPPYKPLGVKLKEAEVCTKFLVDSGNIPFQNIITIATATSTVEEAISFAELCEKKGFRKILVVSSKMHTGRVSRIFNKVFKNSKIKILYHGASTNANFDEQNWWKTEEGLIFVNNEYIKSIYYLFKY